MKEDVRNRSKCTSSFKVAQLISSGSMSAALGLGLQSTKSWASLLGQSQCQARAFSVYFSSVPGNEPFWLWSLGETVELLCKKLSEPCKAENEAELISLAKVKLTLCIGMSLHLTLQYFWVWECNKTVFHMVMDGFILCSWLIMCSLYSTLSYNRKSWVVKDRAAC